jgi:hypothetical protein
MDSSLCSRAVRIRRTLIGAAIVAVGSASAIACGGKVVWVGDNVGGAGGNVSTSSTQSGTANSMGTAGACLTVGNGGGPTGPNMIHTSKCFAWPHTKPCPASVTVGAMIDPDACYNIEAVDAQCVSPDPDECCYDVTEQLVCKG